MRIFTEITSLLEADFLTGIQRTVIEIASRLIRYYGENYFLVICRISGQYQRVNNADFLRHFVLNETAIPLTVSEDIITLDDMSGDTSVFLDLDAVWNGVKDVRQFLYPALKKRNIRIFTYVYDIIPVTHPQFAAVDNHFFFPRYIAAVLAYADIIMPSTEYTVKELQNLCRQIELPARPEAFITVPLGCDFAKGSSETGEIPQEVKELTERGKYILCVSTIEPRKNHKLLLDAFEGELRYQDINLIFVGRYGWNVEALRERIETSPLLGEKLFHLSGLNDASVKYLYAHAFLVAFPTLVEGYGLSTVEALMAGTPVLLSDTAVSHEVGQEFCDYFDPLDPSSFSSAVMRYLADPEYYNEKKRNIKAFVPQTWEDSAEKIRAIIDSFHNMGKTSEKIEFSQVLMFADLPEAVLNTLPYYEKYTEFIERVLIICPETLKKNLTGHYNGRLRISFLTEEELLGEIPDSAGEAYRRSLLFCLAVKHPKVDRYFLFADGNFRPINEIRTDRFFQEGKMRAYYCYDLDDWPRNVRNATLFDESMMRTNLFLRENDFCNLMYESGMPQLICKEYYLEMLERNPAVAELGGGICSVYFNYLLSAHPGEISVEPYCAAAWPGDPASWDQTVFPKEYCFERYTEDSYKAEGIYAGLNRFFSNEAGKENLKKIQREKEKSAKWKTAKLAFNKFEADYRSAYKDHPSIVLDSDLQTIRGPRYLRLPGNTWTYIPVSIKGRDDCSIGWGRRKDQPEDRMQINGRKQIFLPFFCGEGTQYLYFFIINKEESCRACLKIRTEGIAGGKDAENT